MRSAEPTEQPSTKTPGALWIEYTSLMNETTHMPKVYAVLAMGTDYYDNFELVKIFGSKESAEAYVEELLDVVVEDEWGDAEPEPAWSRVKIIPYSVN